MDKQEGKRDELFELWWKKVEPYLPLGSDKLAMRYAFEAGWAYRTKLDHEKQKEVPNRE